MSKREARIALKRVYEKPEASDGIRVLVDRLWPRGISKEHAQVGVWLKEIAPSNELRTWFAHDPAKFSQFRQQYKEELATGKGREALAQLCDIVRKEHVTLVFAAQDVEHNNAIVLRDLIQTIFNEAQAHSS